VRHSKILSDGNFLHVYAEDNGITIAAFDRFGEPVGTIENSYEELFKQIMALNECKKCGSTLNDEGFCDDETCPYSDRQQNESYTEG